MMNADRKNFRNLFFFVFLCICIFFIADSCGLEEYYYLDPPVTDGHTCYATSSDKVEDYFSFLTQETDTNANYINSSSEFTCLGTEVYYKIYSNYSKMTSIESTISSLSGSTSTATTAAEKLIDTYGYKTLNLSSGSLTPLVKASGKNRFVYIRLNDYSDSENYENIILTGTSKISSYDSSSGDTVLGNPRRYINSSYGFNFTTATSGDYTTSNNPQPTSSDDDVNYTTVSDEDVWYVDMYAVTVGRDSTYTYSYSKPLFLGSLKIEMDDYD